MIISEFKKLSEIQTEFNTKFSNLKIEFYTSAHEVNKPSAASHLIPIDKTIAEVRTVHSEGDISINGHLKVSTFEKQFSEKFGLNVQVFRKSGDVWLQTTKTDDWTLSEQNERSSKFSNSIK